MDNIILSINDKLVGYLNFKTATNLADIFLTLIVVVQKCAEIFEIPELFIHPQLEWQHPCDIS